MEKIIFRCKTCKVALSEPLALLRDESKLGREDGEPYVPAGYFAPANDEYCTQVIGRMVINFSDGLKLKHHPDSERLIGCCGPGGYHGRNVLCAKGHEVGTERSDCYQLHGLEFDPDCVEMVKVDTARKKPEMCNIPQHFATFLV